MRVDPTREELFEEAMNWTDRPLPDERLDVLLHYFLGILNALELQTARKMRDEIISHFGGRYCSDKTCSLMAELINGHLTVGQNGANGD
jgi:hypothetical protein